MPKFVVYEIWTRAQVIEADTEADALESMPEPIDGMTLCNWYAVPVDTTDERVTRYLDRLAGKAGA